MRASRGLMVLVVLLPACETPRSGGGGSDGGRGPIRVESDEAPAVSADPGTAPGPDAGSVGRPDASQRPTGCKSIPGVSYRTMGVARHMPPTDPPPDRHPDINLHVRGWGPTSWPNTDKTLIPIAGPADPGAPKLYTLFVDSRVPVFTSTQAVREWDWARQQVGPLITFPYVTLLGMGTTVDEVLQAPKSGYTIGEGQTALVLFVSDDTITLKYTRDDIVDDGYTIHIVGICVEPQLRQLYEQCHRAGRKSLPSLAGRQPIGRALGPEILVSSRDKGSFGDPRDRSEW